MLVFHDARADLHDTGAGHPERVARIAPVLRAADRLDLRIHSLDQDARSWPDVKIKEAAQAVHTAPYLKRLQSACCEDLPFIDEPDSAICAHSFDAALASTGCALAAAEAIATNITSTAFVAMRPPGHHCEADRSCGFCLLNNIAIAARYLLDQHNVERIAIVDFDVHHGNGTQHIFDATDEVLYISSHQDPNTIFPGTGFADETGTPDTTGFGHTLNLPLPPESNGEMAASLYHTVVAPRLMEYQPEVILISAGFDADQRDPLAGLIWQPETFGEITRIIREVADSHSQGRILSLLEGGYHQDALEEGCETHLTALIE